MGVAAGALLPPAHPFGRTEGMLYAGNQREVESNLQMPYERNAPRAVTRSERCTHFRDDAEVRVVLSTLSVQRLRYFTTFNNLFTQSLFHIITQAAAVLCVICYCVVAEAGRGIDRDAKTLERQLIERKSVELTRGQYELLGV